MESLLLCLYGMQSLTPCMSKPIAALQHDRHLKGILHNFRKRHSPRTCRNIAYLEGRLTPTQHTHERLVGQVLTEAPQLMLSTDRHYLSGCMTQKHSWFLIQLNTESWGKSTERSSMRGLLLKDIIRLDFAARSSIRGLLLNDVIILDITRKEFMVCKTMGDTSKALWRMRSNVFERHTSQNPSASTAHLRHPAQGNQWSPLRRTQNLDFRPVYRIVSEISRMQP